MAFADWTVSVHLRPPQAKRRGASRKATPPRLFESDREKSHGRSAKNRLRPNLVENWTIYAGGARGGQSSAAGAEFETCDSTGTTQTMNLAGACITATVPGRTGK